MRIFTALLALMLASPVFGEDDREELMSLVPYSQKARVRDVEEIREFKATCEKQIQKKFPPVFLTAALSGADGRAKHTIDVELRYCIAVALAQQHH